MYEKFRFSTLAPVNSTLSFPAMSSTTGFSSKIPNTLLAEAKVLFRELPRFAKAITGPNDENMANTGITPPSRFPVPLLR